MPKVELHLHLDCSLSFEVVQRIAPSLTEEEYAFACIAPHKCHDLADYIARAEAQIRMMQTVEHLQWVTEDLFRQLQADHVVYAEIRFAPLEHTREGLSAEEVVERVSATMDQMAVQTGIESGLILCTLRHYSEQQSLQTAKLVQKYAGNSRVVGFDIAADEANFSIDAHKKAFAYAFDQGLSCTAHAGEARGPESVWETLEYFRPTRLGHGIRSIEDPALIDHLLERSIYLEVCPTSNVQTTVVEAMQHHPVDQLRSFGLKVGINTDGRTISNVTLAHEYQQISDHFGWKEADFRQMNLDALQAAFCAQALKKRVKALLD